MRVENRRVVSSPRLPASYRRPAAGRLRDNDAEEPALVADASVQGSTLAARGVCRESSGRSLSSMEKICLARCRERDRGSASSEKKTNRGWLPTHGSTATLWSFLKESKSSATEAATAETAMAKASAPIATVEDPYRRAVVAIVGVVRSATPIGTATRVIRWVRNRVTAGVTAGTLPERARVAVVIGTGGLKGLAAVFC